MGRVAIGGDLSGMVDLRDLGGASIPEGDREAPLTDAASKIVFRSSPSQVAEGGLSAVQHAASGTKIINPARVRVICCTLKRHAGRLALRLLFRQLRLEIEYLALKTRYSYLRSIRKVICYAKKY